MALKRTLSWFIVPKEAIESLSAMELLEILRYDKVLVQPHAPDGFILFTTENSAGPSPVIWKKYAVPVVAAIRSHEDWPPLTELKLTAENYLHDRWVRRING